MKRYMNNTIKTTVVSLVSLAICYGLASIRITMESMYLEVLIFVISLYVLVTAAGRFTELSIIVGNSLGISKLATGILIIAIGTSAPEIFSSIGAAIRHQPDIVVGNILGTVVTNSLLGIGCGALAATRSLTVHRDVFGTQMSVFLSAIMLSIGGLYDGGLEYYEGLIMIALLVCYLYYVIKTQNNINVLSKNINGVEDTEKSIIGVVILLIANLGSLFLSGDLIVSSLIESAKLLEFSSAKLAASILAVGTSIPEIATAIALARQNNADSLFGEIIGSNIFDILGILGFISLFETLSMEIHLLGFLAVSLFFMFVVTSTIMNDKSINRIEGVSLISLFLIFTIQLMNL